MMNETWLIDDVRPPDASAIRQIERETPAAVTALTRGTGHVPRLSIMLREVICHDVHKLFGGADIRLDALVVHGRGRHDDASSFYMPATFRFTGVHDHQPLPIDPSFGLLIFNGVPLHFVDIFIMASRDTGDSDDLASLLRRELGSAKTQGAVGALVGVAVASPVAATVTAAFASAVVLGDVAYRVIRAVSGTTVGMYRASFLQHRDRFGIGRHPPGDLKFIEADLEFWYETLLDGKESSNQRGLQDS
jgi:hypothetical protein